MLETACPMTLHHIPENLRLYSK